MYARVPGPADMTPRSFLPQIVGVSLARNPAQRLTLQVFYATFHPTLGPTVLHQVPENLIISSSSEEAPSRSVSASRSPHPRPNTSTHRSYTPSRLRPQSGSSSPSRSSVDSEAILDFSPISEYVIPKKALHGRLVSLLTTGLTDDEEGGRAEYRVMGFPSVIEGASQYTRNEYMWNLCFVFQASSSLEAFEPVVRKCARILRSAEVRRLPRCWG